MSTFLNGLFDQLAGQGLSVSLTVVAVVYLNGKIKECEADRKALWDKILEHLED